jgi:ABC-type nickel/cobalt efflux system permease component RcnA
MPELESALASGDMAVLLMTAVALGFIHTILGPDHYVPFVMMAHAQNWSRSKTAVVTTLCGLGHVASSLIIGAALVWGGMAVTEWADSRWAFWHEMRGSLSAWLLMGVGAAFVVWGVVRARRGATHSHPHLHSDRTLHSHEHSHTDTHIHVHNDGARRLTPWVLFTIFVFGPCESLIPLMLSAWSVSGTGGVTLVAVAFGTVTIATMLGAVGLLVLGIRRIPLGPMERWSTVLAGLSLVVCGGAIQWLGL